jgi:hypothetical protein
MLYSKKTKTLISNIHIHKRNSEIHEGGNGLYESDDDDDNSVFHGLYCCISNTVILIIDDDYIC